MKSRTAPADLRAVQMIVEYMAAHGYAPTVREIGAMLGYASSSSAHVVVQRLKAQGLIDYKERTNRTIRILRKAVGADRNT